MANFFPRWTNWLPLKITICGIVVVTAALVVVVNLLIDILQAWLNPKVRLS